MKFTFSGRHSMANNEIAENVIEVIKHLGAVHPGGSNNINKIDLKTNVNVGASVPIFINTGECDEILPCLIVKAF